MSYKLYTDKQEVFECKISLEGASLKKATARILIESNDINLMFPGKIDKNGNCKVPIKKLKGFLDEKDKGNIKLEVIAEDTYFEPWQSEFVIETAKKIKVEVKGQSEVKKPKAVVTEIKKQVIINKDPIQEMSVAEEPSELVCTRIEGCETFKNAKTPEQYCPTCEWR